MGFFATIAIANVVFGWARILYTQYPSENLSLFVSSLLAPSSSRWPQLIPDYSHSFQVVSGRSNSFQVVPASPSSFLDSVRTHPHTVLWHNEVIRSFLYNFVHEGSLRMSLYVTNRVIYNWLNLFLIIRKVVSFKLKIHVNNGRQKQHVRALNHESRYSVSITI